jgi:hypothetical protein
MAKKIDHRRYGHAVRLALDEEERQALRMAAAKSNVSQGKAATMIIRKALIELGWLVSPQAGPGSDSST